MNLVTIITPIYNGEKYLIRYFEQLNAIRYKNLQIIVVNDGSKDKTSEIVQKYAEEDNRIEFIDKKLNEGVSSARNDALKRAKGTFCFFFDCDDTFDAQIVEKCVAKVKSDTDTVCYNYASVRRNGSIAEHEFSYLKHQYNKKRYSGTNTAKILWNIDSRLKGIYFRKAWNASRKGTKRSMAYDVFARVNPKRKYLLPKRSACW